MQETNKQIVRDFYELAFNQHKPTEAAKKYFGDKYKQHNPYVKDGASAFYLYFEGFFKQHAQSRVDIKRVLADGDLVALHLHSVTDANDRGRAIVEIFRLDRGKIVEHWDAVQDVPAQPANANTMF